MSIGKNDTWKTYLQEKKSVGKEVNRKKSHWENMSLGKYINGKNCPRKISLGKRCQQENIAINGMNNECNCELHITCNRVDFWCVYFSSLMSEKNPKSRIEIFFS